MHNETSLAFWEWLGWSILIFMSLSAASGLLVLIHHCIIAPAMGIFGIETPFGGWFIFTALIALPIMAIGGRRGNMKLVWEGGIAILLPIIVRTADVFIVERIAIELCGIGKRFWGWYLLLLPVSVLLGISAFVKHEKKKREREKEKRKREIEEGERERENLRNRIIARLPTGDDAELLIDTCTLMDCRTMEGKYFFDVAEQLCRERRMHVRILKEVYWELERHYNSGDARKKKMKAQNAKKLILDFQKQGFVRTSRGGFGFGENNESCYADTAIMKHLRQSVKKRIPISLITEDIGLMVRARALLSETGMDAGILICSMKEFCSPAAEMQMHRVSPPRLTPTGMTGGCGRATGIDESRQAALLAPRR